MGTVADSTGIKISWLNDWRIPLLILIVTGLWVLSKNYITSPITCLGLTLIPIVAQPKNGKYSARFLIPALLLIVASLIVPIMTVAYFAWLLTIFLIIEINAGKISLLVIFLTGIVSPIFSYVVKVFSFSLRLQLSALAGKFLSVLGQTTVEGNIIFFRGEESSVDPACMGLMLTVTSLILGIVFLARIERHEKRHLPFWFISISLSIFFGLIVIANLIRIIILVCFNILPDTILHDIIGLVCLLFYVIVPGYYAIETLHRRWPSFGNEEKSKVIRLPRWSVASVSALTIYMLISSYLHLASTTKPISVDLASIDGRRVTKLPHQVIKLHNATSLIYLKSIKDFYSTEHNPALCWTGSGYEFKQVKESRIGNQLVYEGKLVKGNAALFTAWWYQSSNHITISQWDWRSRIIKEGESFHLVNVTASSHQNLWKEVINLQQSKLIAGILTP